MIIHAKVHRSLSKLISWNWYLFNCQTTGLKSFYVNFSHESNLKSFLGPPSSPPPLLPIVNTPLLLLLFIFFVNCRCFETQTAEEARWHDQLRPLFSGVSNAPSLREIQINPRLQNRAHSRSIQRGEKKESFFFPPSKMRWDFEKRDRKKPLRGFTCSTVLFCILYL